MSGEGKRWRVVGVDQDSGHETSMVVQASSSAVAKVMGERKGIHVAEVVDIVEEEREQVRRELRGGKSDEPDEPEKRRAPRPGEIVCPNPHCAYVGPPKKESRGSVLAFVLLALLFLFPAIIYAIFMRGYRYSCPRCGIQIRSDL